MPHYAWSGNKKAGGGSMEITGSSAEGIVIALEFLKPFKSHQHDRCSASIPRPSGDRA